MKDGLITEGDLQKLGWKQRSLIGFIQSAGPLWTRREGIDWQYGILTDSSHSNPAGMVHGGLLATLMDHTLSAVAWEAIGRRACVTVQLDTQFLVPVVPGAFLQATAKVVRSTRSLVFVQGTLAVDDEVVLSGSAVLKVLTASQDSYAGGAP
jgi:uncharacterized protein (TIGR00369 family)